jgi:hypothetical protein
MTLKFMITLKVSPVFGANRIPHPPPLNQGNVTDVGGLRHILRYNDYEHDPFSDGSPFNSICSRGDLAKVPHLGGCYDTKAMDRQMFLDMKAWVINGPTAQDQPVSAYRRRCFGCLWTGGGKGLGRGRFWVCGVWV